MILINDNLLILFMVISRERELCVIELIFCLIVWYDRIQFVLRRCSNFLLHISTYSLYTNLYLSFQQFRVEVF